MDLEQFISLVSSIAALFTTFLVLFTLFEMQKQRKSAYKPELVFSESNFYVYSKGKKYSDIMWSSKEFEGNIDIEKEGTYASVLNAYNIGMGAAKEIKISWKFGYDKLISILKEKDHDNEFTFEIVEKRLNIISNSSFSSISLDMECHVDYVIPIQLENKPLKIFIPFLYLSLMSQNIYFIFKSLSNKSNISDITEEEFHKYMGNKFKNLKKELNHLDFEISYKDIGNNVYNNKYRVILDVHEFTGPNFKNKNDQDNYRKVLSGQTKIEKLS